CQLPEGIRGICCVWNKSQCVLLAQIARNSPGDVRDVRQRLWKEGDPSGSLTQSAKNVRIFFFVRVRQTYGINHDLRLLSEGQDVGEFLLAGIVPAIADDNQG